jgi:hypothetical protein
MMRASNTFRRCPVPDSRTEVRLHGLWRDVRAICRLVFPFHRVNADATYIIAAAASPSPACSKRRCVGPRPPTTSKEKPIVRRAR